MKREDECELSSFPFSVTGVACTERTRKAFRKFDYPLTGEINPAARNAFREKFLIEQRKTKFILPLWSFFWWKKKAVATNHWKINDETFLFLAECVFLFRSTKRDSGDDKSQKLGKIRLIRVEKRLYIFISTLRIFMQVRTFENVLEKEKKKKR